MADIFRDRQTRDRAVEVADLICATPDQLAAAWELYRQSRPPLRERLCWAIWLAIERRPDLVTQAWMEEVAAALPTMQHDAEKRNFMHLMADFPIPESCEADIYDLAFTWLNNPLEAVANRVHAMEVLYQIGTRHPDLHHELALALRTHMPYASPGFKSRANKILARIKA